MMESSENGSKIFAVCEIRHYLLISGYCALSKQLIEKLGVTHAVDATNIPKTLRVSTVNYLTVNVDDSELSNLKPHFEAVTQHVAEAKNTGGKALVYCAAGISRSAALCIVALMQLERLSLSDAYHEVLIVRPIIAPNIGFWRQMIDFENKTRGITTVELLKGMRRLVPSVYLNRSEFLSRKT